MVRLSALCVVSFPSQTNHGGGGAMIALPIQKEKKKQPFPVVFFTDADCLSRSLLKGNSGQDNLIFFKDL